MLEHDLVLLPGLDGTGTLFGPFLSSLPPEYPATVVSYPPDERLNSKQLLSYIRAKIPWDKPYTIVAESFSGPLAMEFVAAQPENVRAVVLVCSFVDCPIPGWLKLFQGLLKDSWFKKKLPEKYAREYLLGEDCPELLMNAFYRAIEEVRPEVLAYRVRELFTVDARVALQNCRKPILYLLAEQDKLLGKRGWETIAAFRPNLTTVVLEGPHLLLQRKPKEAFASMEKFLAGLDANEAGGAVRAA